MPIKPWSTSHSKAIGDFRIFSLRSDTKVSPRTGASHDFYIIDCVNWVNVVALTSDHQVVMVDQYRHGSSTVELEIPGGMIDAEDSSPVATAIRELREETGYEGEQAQVIGEVYPNPAIMSNRCFTVLIQNCELRHPIALDSGEDLLTHLLPASRMPELVAAHRIKHSLVVAALYHFELWHRNGGLPAAQ